MAGSADSGVFNTRPWFVAAAAVVMAAWAVVGLATGHVYLVVGRGTVHFQELPAFTLALSVAVAGAAFVSLLRAGRARSTRWLMVACLVLFVMAVAMKAAAARWPQAFPTLNGLITAHELRAWLGQPQIAAWAARAAPGLDTWLMTSCTALLFCALLLRLAGVTKESAQRAPALVTAAFLAFGTPFLAWFTIDFFGYVFLSVPAIASSEEFVAKASFALSVLIVVLALWWLVALALVVLLLRIVGGRVQWARSAG